MKWTIILLLSATVLATACIHKGAESKQVKFLGFDLVGDGNNNDSTFFELRYENKSSIPLKEPYLRMVIKDTSDKVFKHILYSESQNLPDIAAHSPFTVYFYAENFQYSAKVGKTKFYLSWTNSKGKKSIRRKVEF